MSGSLGFILTAVGSQRGFEARKWHAICVLETGANVQTRLKGVPREGNWCGAGGRAVGERLPVDLFLLRTLFPPLWARLVVRAVFVRVVIMGTIYRGCVVCCACFVSFNPQNNPRR